MFLVTVTSPPSTPDEEVPVPFKISLVPSDRALLLQQARAGCRTISGQVSFLIRAAAGHRQEVA